MKTPKEPIKRYRFTDKWSTGGTTFFPGVSFTGPIIEENSMISKADHTVFVNIPKEIIEEFEPEVKYKREIKKKTTKALNSNKKKEKK